MKAKALDDTGKYFSAKAEIARAYGVHRHTVDGWEGKGLLGKTSQRGYHRETVCQNVDDYLAEKQKGGDKDEKTRLECERLRVVIQREQELVEQAKIETLRQQGKLMERAEHDRICDAYMHLYLGSLDHLIENVSTRLRSAKARTILQDAVDSVRQNIANMATSD